MFVKENPDKKKPCSFKLLIRSAERLRRTENSVQEIEIICKMLNRKILKPFQSYLSNGSNKTNLNELHISMVERNIARTFMIVSISLSGKSSWYDTLLKQMQQKNSVLLEPWGS